MTSRQHLSRLLLVAGTLALGGLLAGACDSGTPADTGDGGQHGDGPANCAQPGLFLVSPQSVTLSAQATAELKVRYACDSTPYPGALVNFVIEGDGKGSLLSSASSQTDDAGVATVTLTSGTQSATFTVKASTPDTAAVTFSITVNTTNVGTIVVHMTYAGTTVYNEYKAYLLQNVACTTINAFNVTGALQEAVPVTVISATPQFINVPVAANYTVAVTAKKTGIVLGFGCTPTVAVTAGAKTDTTVAIEDIPVRYTGTYYLDNRFDMTGLLPPTVDNIVHIFDEMTDDTDVEGNTATQDFGVDPAAFLLDFVYREICHWQCNGGETYDTCSEINHGWGDQKLIYTEDFTSWSGNIPRFYGACGILDESWGVNQYIQNQVQAFILNNIPNVVLRVLEMVGDLARAIDQMHIKSKLTLNDVRPGRQGDFSHELQIMYVLLHDLSGAEHNIEVDLAQAGIGTLTYSANTTVTNDKLQIPQHEFILKFGKLVQYIYLEYLLPLLGYTKTGEMFQDWIDCNAVGDWLYQELIDAFGTSPAADTLEQYCNTGLMAGGDWVDSSMASWISGDTKFRLTGECEPDEITAERVANKLKNGVWAGYWEDADTAAHANFTGTFTGAR